MRIGESGLRLRVNKETADAHNLYGWDAVPLYVVDHTTTVPIYMTQRDICDSNPKVNLEAAESVVISTVVCGRGRLIRRTA